MYLQRSFEPAHLAFGSWLETNMIRSVLSPAYTAWHKQPQDSTDVLRQLIHDQLQYFAGWRHLSFRTILLDDEKTASLFFYTLADPSTPLWIPLKKVPAHVYLWTYYCARIPTWDLPSGGPALMVDTLNEWLPLLLLDVQKVAVSHVEAQSLIDTALEMFSSLAMMDEYRLYEGLVSCGDRAARMDEHIWQMLVDVYRDNLPPFSQSIEPAQDTQFDNNNLNIKLELDAMDSDDDSTPD